MSLKGKEKGIEDDATNGMNGENDTADTVADDPALDADNVRSLVLSYLLHHCYVETAQAFMQANSLEQKGAKLTVGLSERKVLLERVRGGDIVEAMATADKVFPGLLTKRTDVKFKLLCMQFIEFVRRGDNQNALLFAQQELNTYAQSDPTFMITLQEIFPLIAYEQPEKSPLAEYMSIEYREKVIATFNSAIQEHQGLPSEAPLETFLRHLTVAASVVQPDKPLAVGPVKHNT
eukprot:TRINITY_DN4094_c0_g1_i1.p1 TRINITY_DN4094_c0_g1~~TRINITY_DN4094_c0_g1_i1.p1  ORF type:complete len:234 (-),score=46.67 TRINITY_DN4094_c0_g1_i1:97-798(-)